MASTTRFLRFFFSGFLLLTVGFVSNSVGSTNYTTNFSLTENPIFESGKWINGKSTGLDWADVRTTAGLAYGTQTDTIQYDDSTAVLSGTWGADQSAWATVHTVNQSSNLIEEVELRLRTTITTHSITGYGINFRCTADGSQYVQIVRWNGPLGSFTYINRAIGPGIHNGDTVKATIAANTINVYINSTQILQGTDATYTSGSPGLGFYIQGGSASQEVDYGLSSFTATDESGSGAASPLSSSSVSPLSSSSDTYTTNFPLTENPISEGGNWAGGQSAGGNFWGNVQTSSGLAFGVSEPTTYGDPTAILNGSWSPNQSVSVTVKINTAPTACCHEVEARLLTTISANSIKGYEINCSVVGGSRYIQLVRWNGPNGNFTYLDQLTPATSCANGDVLVASATVSGGTVTFGLTRNGVAQTFTTCNCTNPHDSSGSAILTGNPGIGFYDNQDNNWNYFGFSSLTASGLTTAQKPNPPTGLTTTVN